MRFASWNPGANQSPERVLFFKAAEIVGHSSVVRSKGSVYLALLSSGTGLADTGGGIIWLYGKGRSDGGEVREEKVGKKLHLEREGAMGGRSEGRCEGS